MIAFRRNKNLATSFFMTLHCAFIYAKTLLHGEYIWTRRIDGLLIVKWYTGREIQTDRAEGARYRQPVVKASGEPAKPTAMYAPLKALLPEVRGLP